MQFPRTERSPEKSRVATWSPLRRAIRGDAGQDMIEYALGASFVSIAAILARQALAPLSRAPFSMIWFVLRGVVSGLI